MRCWRLRALGCRWAHFRRPLQTSQPSLAPPAATDSLQKPRSCCKPGAHEPPQQAPGTPSGPDQQTSSPGPTAHSDWAGSLVSPTASQSRITIAHPYYVVTQQSTPVPRLGPILLPIAVGARVPPATMNKACRVKVPPAVLACLLARTLHSRKSVQAPISICSPTGASLESLDSRFSACLSFFSPSSPLPLAIDHRRLATSLPTRTLPPLFHLFSFLFRPGFDLRPATRLAPSLT